MPDPATTAALLAATQLVAGGRSGGAPPDVGGGTGGFLSALPGLGNIASGLNRTRSRDRPIAETDLQKLLFDVQARPFAYDEPAEFDRLIRINRPGARQQIADALRVNRLSIFGPPPMLTASTAPLPPLGTSAPISGPFDPRLPVPVPKPGPMRVPGGGAVAAGIIVLENLYRLYDSTEREIERLQSEAARMGEVDKALQKRIKQRERELRREQRQRERDIRRRERELRVERRQLARKAGQRIRDVAEEMRVQRRGGARRKIAGVGVRITERDVLPSVAFPAVKPTIIERGISAARAVAAAAPMIVQRAQQASQVAQLLGQFTRQRRAPAPVAAGFAAPAAPAPVAALSPVAMLRPATAPAPALTDPAIQRCIERARKPRKPRKPRDVCYRGSYIETRTGVRKRRREEIPCD